MSLRAGTGLTGRRGGEGVVRVAVAVKVLRAFWIRRLSLLRLRLESHIDHHTLLKTKKKKGCGGR